MNDRKPDKESVKTTIVDIDPVTFFWILAAFLVVPVFFVGFFSH